MHRRVVLASSSRYRAEMLSQAGWEAVIDPPEIDERALDDELGRLGADGLALELARRKAATVASRQLDAVVIAGDQVGVVDGPGRAPLMLTKHPTVQGAVDQLMAMSGTTHQLVNGLVVVDTGSGRTADGVDRQLVTMRRFDRSEAEAYVERFQPFDSSGSYRLEDQSSMDPLKPFVIDVEGEDPSGVLGLPLPLLGRLMAQLGILAP